MSLAGIIKNIAEPKSHDTYRALAVRTAKLAYDRNRRLQTVETHAELMSIIKKLSYREEEKMVAYDRSHHSQY